MDIGRAERIADVIKTTKQLGKNIKKPNVYETTDRSVEGTGIMKILMYFVAGLLLIGLILLGVDQWITPIFIRTPGGRGYIPIPGTDLSQINWTSANDISNIVVGTASAATPSAGTPSVGTPAATPARPSTNVIVGQSSFSITMDVFIASNANTLAITTYNNMNPTVKPKRTIFFLGTSTTNSTTTNTALGSASGSGTGASEKKLIVEMDSYINNIYITAYNKTSSTSESAIIENVPMNIPFRLGIVVSPYTLEAYLNGRLVMTRQLKASSIQPSTSDIIYAPNNILYTPPSGTTNTFSLAEGIKVMNLRTFGYEVTPAEMSSRMYDLVAASVINPQPK